MADDAISRRPHGAKNRRRPARGWLALALAVATLGLTRPAAAQLPRARDLPRELPVRSPEPATVPDPTASIPASGPAAAEGAALVDLETRLLALGPVTAGEIVEVPGAIRMRVVSDDLWFLYLTSDGLLVEDRGRLLPASRLSWRGGDGGEFRPLSTGTPVLVARGAATGRAGHPVSIDLRLEVDDRDPIGRLRADLRLQLAAN